MMDMTPPAGWSRDRHPCAGPAKQSQGLAAIAGVHSHLDSSVGGYLDMGDPGSLLIRDGGKVPDGENCRNLHPCAEFLLQLHVAMFVGVSPGLD